MQSHLKHRLGSLKKGFPSEVQFAANQVSEAGSPFRDSPQKLQARNGMWPRPNPQGMVGTRAATTTFLSHACRRWREGSVATLTLFSDRWRRLDEPLAGGCLTRPGAVVQHYSDRA